MSGGIYADIWSYQTIVTYFYFGVIKHHAVITCIEIIANMNIAAEVALKSTGNCRIYTDRTKKFSDYSQSLIKMRQWQAI